MRFIMPWPPTTLSPNARVHWSKLAKAKKEYRNACAWTAISQGARRIDAAGLHVSLTFHPPSRRAIDLDNCLARFKSGIDGLVDVLQVDDSKWRLTIQKAEEVGGFVKVELLEVIPPKE
jgi:crossover junction endodeoxyribonuclease RusA